MMSSVCSVVEVAFDLSKLGIKRKIPSSNILSMLKVRKFAVKIGNYFVAVSYCLGVHLSILHERTHPHLSANPISCGAGLSV